MSDLIDRQAAIDAIDEQIAQCNKALKSLELSMKDLYAVKVEKASLTAFRERLEYLPPAQPQRTGKCMWCERLKERNLRIEYYWIDQEGCTASFSEPHIVATGIAKFCPNCGAKMTEGDAE